MLDSTYKIALALPGQGALSILLSKSRHAGWRYHSAQVGYLDVKNNRLVYEMDKTGK